MKIKFILLFLLLFGFSFVEAGTVRAILLGDDLDPKCGSGFKQSIRIVEMEAHRIAKKLRMPCQVINLEGRNVSSTGLIRAVNQLDIYEDDVVILYCACHGYRTPSKKNRWPSLLFKRERRGVDFGALHTVIERCQPKFLLAIADCCNNILPENRYPLVPVKSPRRLNSVTQESGRSFLGEHKSFVVSAARPTEFSWVSLRDGNFFIRYFIQSMREEEGSNSGISWERVLKKTSRQIEEKVNVTKPLSKKQHPQYKLT